MYRLSNIPHDKLLHFAICAVITSVLHLFLPTWATMLIVMGVAVGKEIYDKVSGKGSAEWGDVAADVLGIIVGI